eukprot:8902209-Heterocapsa_arctica.AAC.1
MSKNGIPSKRIAENKVNGGHTGNNTEQPGQPHRLKIVRQSFPGNRRHRLDKLDKHNKTRQEYSSNHNRCRMGYNSDNMSKQKEGTEDNDGHVHRSHRGLHEEDWDILDNGFSSFQSSTVESIISGFYAWAVVEDTAAKGKALEGAPIMQEMDRALRKGRMLE